MLNFQPTNLVSHKTSCVEFFSVTHYTIFLQLVASIVYCAVYLIWYYPDAFAYIGAVSAVITVALKFAGVVVQGPETKKVMVLLNARKVNLVSYAYFLL